METGFRSCLHYRQPAGVVAIDDLDRAVDQGGVGRAGLFPAGANRVPRTEILLPQVQEHAGRCRDDEARRSRQGFDAVRTPDDQTGSAR